ncbi:hypothetical protein FGG78_28000, partial [Thioclava sp. BHET1]
NRTMQTATATRGRYMNVVSVIQAKGGSAKTTTVMLLASAALQKGLRVHVLDADFNKQVMSWQEEFLEGDWGNLNRPDWPTALQVSAAPTSGEATEEALAEIEAQGFDLVLIDTGGGTAAVTETYCLLSDLVIIPARPVTSEYKLTRETYDWMLRVQQTLDDPSAMPPIRILVSGADRAMTEALAADGYDKLPAKRKAVLDALMELDPLNTLIPQSKILEELRFWGPLEAAYKSHAESQIPSARLQARNFATPLAIASEVLAEAISIANGENDG